MAADSPIQNPIKPEAAKNTADNKSENAPTDRMLAKSPVPVCEEQQCSPEKDKTNVREWWKVVVETVTMIAVIWYACIAYHQWQEMRTATNITGKALVASSRAWIAPQNAVLDGELIKNEAFKFEVQYTNIGREPAFDVRPTYSIKSVEGTKFSDNSVNSIIEADDICKKGSVQPAPGADVIYPSLPEGYKLKFTGPTNWISDDTVSGRNALVLEMCFAYRTMEQVHHTSFCFFYRPGLSPNGRFNVCMAGNHAD